MSFHMYITMTECEQDYQVEQLTVESCKKRVRFLTSLLLSACLNKRKERIPRQSVIGFRGKKLGLG